MRWSRQSSDSKCPQKFISFVLICFFACQRVATLHRSPSSSFSVLATLCPHMRRFITPSGAETTSPVELAPVQSHAQQSDWMEPPQSGSGMIPLRVVPSNILLFSLFWNNHVIFCFRLKSWPFNPRFFVPRIVPPLINFKITIEMSRLVEKLMQ